MQNLIKIFIGTMAYLIYGLFICLEPRKLVGLEYFPMYRVGHESLTILKSSNYIADLT